MFLGTVLALGAIASILTAAYHLQHSLSNDAPPSGNRTSFSRIMPLRPAVFESPGYMIKIRTEGLRHLCGGSLITADCILTAAHCVEGYDPKTVSIQGGKRSSLWNAISSASIASYKIPSNYKRPSMNMDVAIIKLAEPLQGKSIKTIPLDFTTVDDFTKVSVSSWAKIASHLPYAAIYRTDDFTVKPWQECDPLPIADNVKENAFCSRDEGKGKDDCPADTGGPVVRNGQQVGVTAGGKCSSNIGVYTKLNSPAVSQFIRTTIDELCQKD